PARAAAGPTPRAPGRGSGGWAALAASVAQRRLPRAAQADHLATRVVVDVREPLEDRQLAKVVVPHGERRVETLALHLARQSDRGGAGRAHGLAQVVEASAVGLAVAVVGVQLEGRAARHAEAALAPALDADPVVDRLAVAGRVGGARDALVQACAELL